MKKFSLFSPPLIKHLSPFSSYSSSSPLVLLLLFYFFVCDFIYRQKYRFGASFIHLNLFSAAHKPLAAAMCFCFLCIRLQKQKTCNEMRWDTILNCIIVWQKVSSRSAIERFFQVLVPYISKKKEWKKLLLKREERAAQFSVCFTRDVGEQ